MNPSEKPPLTPTAVWVIVCAILNAAGWILSALGQLNPVGYSAVFILGGVATGWWWHRAQPRFQTGFRLRRFRRAYPLAFAVVAALALAGGFLHAPSNYDALAYRTPRVLHWLSAGQWHWIHTDFQRLNTRGCGIEWLTAPLLLMTGTTRWLFLINAISFLLLPGLCFRVLTRLGVRPRVAWHWMWVLPAGYCYLLQAGSIGNDLFGATMALVAVDFALRAARERSATAAWLAILAAALMTAGKAFNLLLLLPWGLALLPATGALLRRPMATILVGALAVLISMVPSALLNAHFCGDWKGLKAEPSNLSTGAPVLHLGVNTALITMHNLTPPFCPFAGVWNSWMQRTIPADWAAELGTHFEPGGAQFKLGEMQMEEGAGLGCGVSLLLIPVLFGCLRWPARHSWRATLRDPATLVPVGAWLVTLYFLTQTGFSCPARYLAPSYVLLVVPVLRLPRATVLLGRRWWRGVAMFGFALAALLLIAQPARPLWPAQTLLTAIHAEHSTSPWLRRIWVVYSVYGARPEAFAPMVAALPPHLKTLGLVTFDDPETSLWWPWGSRRIEHVTQADDAQSLRQRGVEWVLVSEYILTDHQQTTLPAWLARFDAEIVTSLDLPLRATRGPTRWHLVHLRNCGNPAAPPARPGAGEK